MLPASLFLAPRSPRVRACAGGVARSAALPRRGKPGAFPVGEGAVWTTSWGDAALIQQNLNCTIN